MNANSYEKHTIGSKNPLKRFLHRQRFSASIKLLYLQTSDNFLDYGCGDGELSRQIAMKYPNVKITAFDPAQELYKQAEKKLKGYSNILVTNNFDRINYKFERIACLETVEHLAEKELNILFTNINSVLKKDGICLFTFPIEHGCISLIKNIYRLLTKRDKFVSIRRTFACLFGFSIEREVVKQISEQNYIYSHIGFRCRDMINKIENNFLIKKIRVLPIGFISFGLGNSIAVLVQKRDQ